jgi:hypothetical protein
MDPEANIREQVEIAKRIQQLTEEQSDCHGYLPHSIAEDIVAEADRLSELVLAMVEWNRRGGFLPNNSVKS